MAYKMEKKSFALAGFEPTSSTAVTTTTSGRYFAS